MAERGFGMDRTFHRLPVLLLDDYSNLTLPVLAQAYVEALYRADQWEYNRMTVKWYERLVYEVAERASSEPLYQKHPVSAEDVSFTRPLVPFTCYGYTNNGTVSKLRCGEGTLRTPAKQCAVDQNLVSPTYNWHWKHHRGAVNS